LLLRFRLLLRLLWLRCCRGCTTGAWRRLLVHAPEPLHSGIWHWRQCRAARVLWLLLLRLLRLLCLLLFCHGAKVRCVLPLGRCRISSIAAGRRRLRGRGWRQRWKGQGHAGFVLGGSRRYWRLWTQRQHQQHLLRLALLGCRALCLLLQLRHQGLLLLLLQLLCNHCKGSYKQVGPLLLLSASPCCCRCHCCRRCWCHQQVAT
jgi:hypothetical protein